MARQPRLVVPGLPIHIVQRGNNRTTCFKGKEDFLVYLALLRELVPEYKCSLHAYCLMPDHVHLLLTPSTERGCGGLMRDSSFRYSQFFNKKYQRTGTLWEGRFRSCLVESRAYVIACHRYIELNPVRAGIATSAAAYPWSSFRSNMGELADPLVTRHAEFSTVGCADYAALLQEGISPDVLKQLRDSTKGGYPLVSDEFKLVLAQRSERRLIKQRPGPKAKTELPATEAHPDLFA
jgi:putative transposase